MLERLGSEQSPDGDGTYSIKMPPTNSSCKDHGGGPPCYVTWERLKKRTNNFSTKAFPTYIQENDITSDLWMAYGLNTWGMAMQGALGELATLPHYKLKRIGKKMRELKIQRQQNLITEQDFCIKRFELTGLPPTQGLEHSHALSAITCLLGGDCIPIEFGGGKLNPSPPWLKWYQPQQVMALHQLNYFKVLGLRHRLNGTNMVTTNWKGGKQLVLSPAIVGSIQCFLASSGGEQDDDPLIGKEEGSPEEAIGFAKKMLASGITWVGGVREYVGFVYRGTVLSAWITCRLEGLGAGIKGFKWARKYIELADNEWKVTSVHQDYSKYGETFRLTFRLNVMSAELQVAQTMRGNKQPSIKDAAYEFELAQGIINIAKTTSKPTGHSFDEWMFYTCFGSKPLAFACSYLAGTMSAMKSNPDSDFLFKVIQQTGLMDPDNDDNLVTFVAESTGLEEFSVNSLIAETYRLGALNQLPDDKELAILWWGCAVHMCYSGGYQIVKLRCAIENAFIATRERDEELWGADVYKGSTQQKQALHVAMYYQEKPDDFILPMLTMETRPDGNVCLFTDGQLLCMNFDKDLRIAEKHFDGMSKEANSYLDIKEVEKEHGAESNSTES